MSDTTLGGFLRETDGTSTSGGRSLARLRQGAEAGEELWTFEADGEVGSSPTVAGGTVYVGDKDGTLHAVDASTGSEQWSGRLDFGPILASPAVSDGTVYVGNNFGVFAAFDASTGTRNWTVEIDGGYTTNWFTSSPLVVEDTVYVGMHDGRLYALDAATGDVAWTFRTGATVYSSPVFADGLVFVGNEAGHVYGVDAGAGTEVWQYETPPNDNRLPGRTINTPTERDGTLYATSFDNRVYALDATTGEEVWTRDLGGPLYGTPTVDDGRVYVPLTEGSPEAVAALDTEAGEEQWRGGGGSARSSPTVAGEYVCVGTSNGHVFGLDAESGDVGWSLRRTEDTEIESSPTVVDGVLFVGTSDATLLAVDAGTPGSSDGSRVRDRSLGYHGATDPDWRGVPSGGAASTERPTTVGTDTPSDRGGTATSAPEANEGPTDSDPGTDGRIPLEGIAGGAAGIGLGGYLLGRRLTDDEEDDG